MKIFSFLLLLLPGLLFSQEIQTRLDAANDEARRVNHLLDSLLGAIENLKLNKIHEDLVRTGLPALRQGDELVHHSAYSLAYCESHEQARWVAHIILPDVEHGAEGRSNDFRPDELVSTGSAEEADYFIKTPREDGTFQYDGFGYDRGHLAPSADFRYSKKALSESFLYSNMSPQVAELNRGRWADMEDAVRQYSVRNQTPVYVVTGGVLNDNLKKIPRGVNQVSIPELYYKVAMDPVNKRAIGFIMPNQECTYPVMHYSVSVDSVEKLTGIDFYPALPDAEESEMESTYDSQKWVGDRELGDVLPLRADSLPRNTFNTVQAQYYVGRNEPIKICGTVVSTKLSSKGNIFLNLDKKFPGQIFTVSIFKDNVSNFSYQPNEFLQGKTICVTGKISDFNGTPSMSIANEKAIQIME
jgi:endonuclease G, mitochondrial